MGANDNYAAAIGQAQIALEYFESYGHGRYLWEAYQAVRLAEKDWPSYRENLRQLAKKIQQRDQMPDVEPIINPTVLDEVRERILTHLDATISDLLSIEKVSEADGARRLRRALAIDGKKAPRNSQARRIENDIVFNMKAVLLTCAGLQARFEKGLSKKTAPPPASQNHLLGIVAKTVGSITKDHVRHCWDEYLADAADASDWHGVIEAIKDNDIRLRVSSKSAKPAPSVKKHRARKPKGWS